MSKKASYHVKNLFLWAVFYVNHMCNQSLLLAYTSGTSPPQGPPLWKIFVIMSLESAKKAADIPVAEGVQENYPKDSDAEVVEALDPEYSEDALF